MHLLYSGKKISCKYVICPSSIKARNEGSGALLGNELPHRGGFDSVFGLLRVVELQVLFERCVIIYIRICIPEILLSTRTRHFFLHASPPGWNSNAPCNQCTKCAES